MTEIAIQLVPITIIGALFSWGNYLLAVRTGRSGWLFAALSFIPIVSLVVMYYTLYSSLRYALDRMPAEPKRKYPQAST
jgi:uncharacterized membrane protein